MTFKSPTKIKLKDSRGSGAQSMSQDNTPLSRDDDFTVPEKDPGRTLAGKRLSGSTQPLGSKTTSAPSHG